jgi:twinkle protein
MDRGNVIGREQCPSCNDRGRDNLIIYDNDSKHCHACGYHVFSDESEQEGIIVSKDLLKGTYTDLPSRGISRKTCEHFGYSVCKNKKGETLHIANYCDSNGSPVAQKIRKKGKQFSFLGNSSEALLFGQQLYEPKDNVFITVVEGEIDALSVAECQGVQFPVVSIPTGAGGANRELSKHLEYLSGFKHVVLLFDNDRSGQEAVENCVELFEPGKVKVASIPLKDANDMIKAGRGSELRSALFNAKDVRPTGLLSVEDILEKELTTPAMGMSWGFTELDKVTYGIQRGGVYTIGAGSGVGKTTVVRDIVANLIVNERCKVVMCSFEQSLSDLRLRMAGYILNVPAHKPEAVTDIKDIDKVWKDSYNNKLFVHENKSGIPRASELYTKMRCYVKSSKADVIVIDNLTQISADEKEERKAIDIIMRDMQKLSVELNITIIIVSHLAKPEGKSYEEGRRVTASALRGSQAIQSNSFFVLGVERDKTAESVEERNVVTLRVLKDRFTGEADGATVRLRYDQETGRLSEWIDDIEEII